MEENIQIVHKPIFKNNPSNPAKIYMDTGLLVLNNSAFSILPDYAQKFVIEHEKGHYLLQTFKEEEADRFAMNRLAYKDKNSLINIIDSVKLITKNDPQRVRSITLSVLQLEAENGNKKAEELLGKLANAVGSPKFFSKKRKYIVTYIIVLLLVLLTIKKL